MQFDFIVKWNLVAILVCFLVMQVNSQLHFGDFNPDPPKEEAKPAEEKKPEAKTEEKKPDEMAHFGHVKIVPQSVCMLRSDPGFCNLILGRWYYDHRYHRCLPFLYTGCGGNTNNFSSMKKCEESTRQCHFISPMTDPLTKHAILNPMNPLGHLANGFVLPG